MDLVLVLHACFFGPLSVVGCHRGSLSGEGPRTQLMLIRMLRCHEVVLFLGGIVNTVEVFVFTFYSYAHHIL